MHVMCVCIFLFCTSISIEYVNMIFFWLQFAHMKYKFHIAALFDSSCSFSLAIFERTQSRYVFSCSTLSLSVFFSPFWGAVTNMKSVLSLSHNERENCTKNSNSKIDTSTHTHIEYINTTTYKSSVYKVYPQLWYEIIRKEQEKLLFLSIH